MSDFLNEVEIESALVALRIAYPSLTGLIPLPNETYLHRRSQALLIRGNPRFDCRPGLIFISGVHAREWGGPDILVNFAADLLEAYTTNSDLAYGNSVFSADVIRSLVDRTDVVVFPLVNPDGYAYSRTGAPDSDIACFRKNRNPASSSGEARKIGVDLNRNCDFLWDFQTKFLPGTKAASIDPADDDFYGTGPFSEPESRNVQWLVDNCPNVSYLVDVHSHHGLVLYPWGDDMNQTTDPSMSFMNPEWDGKRGGKYDDIYREYVPPARLADFRTAADVVRDGILRVRGQTYLIEQARDLYATSGTSHDWAFSRERRDPSRRKLTPLTIEFNRVFDFFPEWSEMLNLIADVDSGLIALCAHARPRAFDVIRCLISKAVRVTEDTFAGFWRHR